MEQGGDDLLSLAISAAQNAGDEILAYYDTDRAVQYDKGDDQPVTRADLASHRTIVEKLAETDIPVISEESFDRTEHESVTGRVWIVDPLDGTKDFIQKTGEFSVMIGLIDQGKSVLGVVYRPVGEIVYYALKNHGAYRHEGRDETQLTVASTADAGDIRMVVSRNHISAEEKDLAERLRVDTFVQMGSAGLKASRVAEGAADLYLSTSSRTKEWDICAADIIVRAAGGRVTDMDGRPFEYGKADPYNHAGIVVSNGRIHESVIEALGHGSADHEGRIGAREAGT